MYLNKALIIGNLTRDPEAKSLPSGIQVTSLGLATNRVWRDKDGNKQENTEFHNIVIFGKQAENVAQYLKKGDSALVEGRLQTRSWEGQDGVKKYRTEIIADRIQFGPKKGSNFNNQDAPKEQNSKQGGDKLDTIEYPDEDINPDDIPF